MRQQNLLIIVITILSIITAGFLTSSKKSTIDENNQKLIIIVRMDDIADYYKQPQIELMKTHKQHKIPVSIGIIPAHFSDTELVSLYKGNELVEICQHGWEHENHTGLSFDMQEQIVHKGKAKLESIFEKKVSVFIPPLYEYNDDTIDVLAGNGFSVLSSGKYNEYDGKVVADFPVTVQYSYFIEGVWVERDVADIVFEVMQSVQERGYAVIGTHPQEFMNGEKVDYGKVRKYQEFIVLLSSSYRIGHFSDIYCARNVDL